MNNFDDLKLATEAMTGGKNTVLLDDVGMPSIMVVIPKMNNKDLVTGATDETHPAFVVDGVEKDKVYISKYLNIVQNNRAYSLPMQDPRAATNFEDTQTYCLNKGNGWGITPYSLWAAIALWSKKNGTLPRGNNNYGSDKTYSHECGVATLTGSDGKTNRTATGSGPVTWNHDFTDAGICDMNGNVAERCAGMRLNNGVLQIIPYANSIKPTCDMGATSNEWKLIGTDGTYGAGTNYICLSYSTENSRFYWSTNIVSNASDASRSNLFTNMSADESISSSGKIALRKLALLPEEDDEEYGADYFSANNGTGEFLLTRGGNWISGTNAGIFATIFGVSRASGGAGVGFRSAYYEL